MSDPRTQLLGEAVFCLPRRFGTTDWVAAQSIQAVEEAIALEEEHIACLQDIVEQAGRANRIARKQHLSDALEEAYPEDEE